MRADEPGSFEAPTWSDDTLNKVASGLDGVDPHELLDRFVESSWGRLIAGPEHEDEVIAETRTMLASKAAALFQRASAAGHFVRLRVVE